MLTWLDVETTGLDPSDGVILEVGIIVTRDDLVEVARNSWMIDCGFRKPIHLCNDFVREMHVKSGLWEDWDDWEHSPRFSHTAAGQVIRAWLTDVGVEKGSTPLCGNNIQFDRRWIQQWCEGLNEFFHYRNIDVSTLKEVMRRVRPDVYKSAPEKVGAHRPLADLEDSIAEYRHYLLAFAG